MAKVCCEGGPLTAGCFHDNCTGPTEGPSKYAEVKFNNGNGALLCNGCRVIIAYGYDHEDRLHFCKSCSDAYIAIDREMQQKIREYKAKK